MNLPQCYFTKSMSQNHHIYASVEPKTTPQMDFSHSTILLILTFFLLLPPSSKPTFDYSTLVYKTCANQTFNNQLSQPYSQTLASLFQQLIAQSSQAKFFKNKEIGNDDTTIISGRFQCRDDMSAEDCFTCVNSIPHMSNTLCSGSISARVQLEGCHVQYETEHISETTSEDDSESSNNILLHKDCGEPITEAYVEFRELMDEAFVALQSGIANSDGYCRTSYKSVQLMAQCEGDSDTCECSECVSDAVHVAKEECGSSLFAQIYLDKCFISYIYHPESDGIPGNSVPGASNNNNTKKLAAIVVGGAAALFLVFIFISLLSSRLKKQDYE